MLVLSCRGIVPTNYIGQLKWDLRVVNGQITVRQNKIIGCSSHVASASETVVNTIMSRPQVHKNYGYRWSQNCKLLHHTAPLLQWLQLLQKLFETSAPRPPPTHCQVSQFGTQSNYLFQKCQMTLVLYRNTQDFIVLKGAKIHGRQKFHAGPGAHNETFLPTHLWIESPTQNPPQSQAEEKFLLSDK